MLLSSRNEDPIPDTPPEIEEILLEGYRRMTPREKLEGWQPVQPGVMQRQVEGDTVETWGSAPTASVSSSRR